MQNSYRCLTGQKILRFFPGCIPCNCYLDSDKIIKNPRYSVDVRYSATQLENNNQLIEEITVQCDCCGKRKSYIVDQYDIYSSQLRW